MNALVKEFLAIIGEFINKRRMEQGRSQQEVADTAGISRTEMHNIEHANTDEKMSTVFRVCHALHTGFGEAILHALYLMDHPECRPSGRRLKNLRGKRVGRSVH